MFHTKSWIKMCELKSDEMDMGMSYQELSEYGQCWKQHHAHYNRPQHTATHCNTLQHTATQCNTLQHTATHCNTLQHTATHCNTHQHKLQHTATPCNTLQHTATHCNTLQHTATQSDEVDMGMSYKELSEYGQLRKQHRAGPLSMFKALVSVL